MRLFWLFFICSTAWTQVSSDRSGFVSLERLVPDVVLEMRYLTAYNFMGEPVDGYKTATCLLTQPAARALAAAQHALRQQGYTLKIYDCYRPQQAVDHFVRWAKDLDNQVMKMAFYPAVDKQNLFRDGYIAARSGHSRGSTVDLTLVRLPPSEQLALPNDLTQVGDCRDNHGQRASDNSVVMGTAYDCFDVLSHTASDRVSAEAQRNRQFLKSVMARHGFVNYAAEWWHYTLAAEPFPATYFDFPVTADVDD